MIWSAPTEGPECRGAPDRRHRAPLILRSAAINGKGCELPSTNSVGPAWRGPGSRPGQTCQSRIAARARPAARLPPPPGEWRADETHRAAARGRAVWRAGADLCDEVVEHGSRPCRFQRDRSIEPFCEAERRMTDRSGRRDRRRGRPALRLPRQSDRRHRSNSRPGDDAQGGGVGSAAIVSRQPPPRRDVLVHQISPGPRSADTAGRSAACPRFCRNEISAIPSPRPPS